MTPNKFLISGVATVGTVGTAVVVSQSGVIFSSKQETSVDIKTNKPKVGEKIPETRTEGVELVDPNQPKTTLAIYSGTLEDVRVRVVREDAEEAKKSYKTRIKEWLQKNDLGNQIIQIQNGGTPKGFEEYGDNDHVLADLPSFLQMEENGSQLKFLASNAQTPFTFEKTTVFEWKILAKSYLDAWVKKVSQDKVTLQVKGLEDRLSPVELRGVFNVLKSNESLFNSGLESYSEQSKKTILFEKINGAWKHTKTEINNWLTKQEGGNNKFSIEVRKNSEGKKTLENADEANLVGLLDYLNKEKNTLLKLVKDHDKKTLVFKSESNVWNVIHNQDTINSWATNTTGKQISLKFYENGNEKTPSNDKEWKELFDSISTIVKKEYKANGGGDDGSVLEPLNDATTIIFEKYKHSKNGKPWTYIKEAIRDYLDNDLNKDDDDEKYYGWSSVKVKIKNEDKSVNKSIQDDDELIGLLKHLQEKKYEKPTNCSGGCYLKLKKKDNEGKEWEEVKNN